MNSNALVLWILGGAGTLLLYSAVKNKQPKDILSKSLNYNGNSGSVSAIAPAQTAQPGTGTGAAMTPVYQPQQGYWNGTDKYGTNLLYSASGQIIGNVPDTYSKSPATYIMSV